MRRTLPDGTEVLIRPIRPDDKSELAAGLQRLSPITVQRRFLSPKLRFTQAELRYLTEVDGHDHVAFVAEPTRRPGLVLAVARWIRWLDRPDSAEAAIVVADPLQGLGLGSLLADELARAGAREGVRRFTATMLSENVPAHRLMRRLATRLDERHDGAGHDELVAELAA